MAHQHLAMWKHTEEQKAILSDSYNRLAVESILDIKRQRDILMKEADDRAAQLSRSYEQELKIIKAKAFSLQSTCEHIVRQRQQEVQIAREELEANHPQYEMGEIRIKALVAKNR